MKIFLICFIVFAILVGILGIALSVIGLVGGYRKRKAESVDKETNGGSEE